MFWLRNKKINFWVCTLNKRPDPNEGCDMLCHFLNYSKCPQISNTFLVLFSSKMFVIKAGIHKMLVKIANKGDPDQTASSEAV